MLYVPLPSWSALIYRTGVAFISLWIVKIYYMYLCSIVRLSSTEPELHFVVCDMLKYVIYIYLCSIVRLSSKEPGSQSLVCGMVNMLYDLCSIVLLFSTEPQPHSLACGMLNYVICTFAVLYGSPLQRRSRIH